MTCRFAARGGHLEVLKWAREHGALWDEGVYHNAAKGGHLEVLQWAWEHGLPGGESTCYFAAQGGHLEVLQWERALNGHWDASTCAAAAEGGHLVGRCRLTLSKPVLNAPMISAREPMISCLQSVAFNLDLRHYDLEILQWAREQDPPCPWDWKTCDKAVRGGHLEVLQC
jgi:hypothetical protein